MAQTLKYLIPIHCPSICDLSNKNKVILALNNPRLRSQTRCIADLQSHKSGTTSMGRRSANYQPSSWSHEFVESAVEKNNTGRGVEKESMKKLEEEVRYMLDDQEADALSLLELIDDIHRLGVAHRFRETTSRALQRLKSAGKFEKSDATLHTSATYFRLLRQHGYQASGDLFEKFKDGNGKFKSSLSSDIEGMLSLYEASHVAFHGERILDEAREFATSHLKDILNQPGIVDINTAERLSHALELPFHHRMQRLEARWNIETYTKQNKGNPTLLTLAKLDFNMVQITLQKDLQEASRWWREMGLANKLSFARDRLMESFFWTVGMVYKPQFSKCRKGLTKVAKLITVVDDVYDVYGSPQELRQLTDAICRWDINAIDGLPDYMKLCFFALYNTINEMAYDTLKEQGEVILPHLTKEWADMCKLFLQEAEWSQKKCIPSFDEYLNNAWISVSGVVLFVHAYYLMTQNITKEAVKCLKDYHHLLRCSSMIFRLANDLGSSKAEIERGETINAITCYMHETGCSEEVARQHMKNLIDQNWKMMNKELVIPSSPFEKSSIETAMNLARIALCQYQDGDAHSSPNDTSRDRIQSVIIQPIRLTDRDDMVLKGICNEQQAYLLK